MNRPLRVTFGPGAFLPGAALAVIVFGFPLGFPAYLFGTLSALPLGGRRWRDLSPFTTRPARSPRR
ncbi:hypothetical protein [Pseudarthrobacter sp. YAF2]|uniref:hypothetical protein n=1 Tax=Pseudarthrobacter sp. YAF2 TaxID=3233078 RepID=UPI003F9CC801